MAWKKYILKVERNLRTEPSLSSDVIMTIPAGSIIMLEDDFEKKMICKIEKGGSFCWSKVKYQNLEGYISVTSPVHPDVKEIVEEYKGMTSVDMKIIGIFSILFGVLGLLLFMSGGKER